MYLKYIISLALIVIFSINIFAANLVVTNISNKDNNISIELNNILIFYNFKLENKNLISPFYESNGNKYYFFYFLDRKFKNNIINNINNKNITNNLKNNIEYKINKCSIPKRPKKILAFMSIIFNNNIEVNCNILSSNYGLWVAWPSVKENGKWTKIFDIKNKKLKKEIEIALITCYKQKRNDDKFKKQ